MSMRRLSNGPWFSFLPCRIIRTQLSELELRAALVRHRRPGLFPDHALGPSPQHVLVSSLSYTVRETFFLMPRDSRMPLGMSHEDVQRGRFYHPITFN